MAGRGAGVLAALGAVLIWGLTFVPSKIALAEMGPFTLAVLRFLIAIAVLLVVRLLRRDGDTPYRRLPWATLALLGFTSVTLYFGLQNLGLERTSASEAGLVSGSVPALTALLSTLLLRERIGRLRLLGIVASMAGVAALVLAGPGGASSGSVEGNLLVLGAACAWALYTLINKRVGGQMPETLLLTYTMVSGTLFMLPAMGLEVGLAGIGPISPASWLSVLFLGLGGSAGAFFCWNAALRRLDASEAATYINLIPLVTVVSATLILGEALVPSQLLGGALVILGVYLAGHE